MEDIYSSTRFREISTRLREISTRFRFCAILSRDLVAQERSLSFTYGRPVESWSSLVQVYFGKRRASWINLFWSCSGLSYESDPSNEYSPLGLTQVMNSIFLDPSNEFLTQAVNIGIPKQTLGLAFMFQNEATK